MKLSLCIAMIVMMVLTACTSGETPFPSATPTLPPGPTPPATPAPTVTPSLEPVNPPTPVPFANEQPASPGLTGVYTLNGTAPDGTVYSGKLTIRLKPDPATGTRQAEYDLMWSRNKIGAGILVTDARGTSYLAGGFGGSACSAVFYSVYYFMVGDVSTFALYGIRLEPGDSFLGTEIASPVVPHPYLEGGYTLTGNNANGKSYKGSLTIAQQGPTIWDLAWNPGLSTPGIGISVDKSLFDAAYGGTGCGVVVYQVMPDGSLHGSWTVWGSDQVGEETASK